MEYGHKPDGDGAGELANMAITEPPGRQGKGGDELQPEFPARCDSCSAAQWFEPCLDAADFVSGKTPNWGRRICTKLKQL